VRRHALTAQEDLDALQRAGYITRDAVWEHAWEAVVADVPPDPRPSARRSQLR
jgi:hypothetical protein